MAQMQLEQSEEMRVVNEGIYLFAFWVFLKLRTFLVSFMWSNWSFNVPVATMKYFRMVKKELVWIKHGVEDVALMSESDEL